MYTALAQAAALCWCVHIFRVAQLLHFCFMLLKPGFLPVNKCLVLYMFTTCYPRVLSPVQDCCPYHYPMCHLTTCLCTSVLTLQHSDTPLIVASCKKANIIQGEWEHKTPSATSNRPNNKRAKSRLVELNLLHVQKQWHVSSCTVFFSHSNTSSRVSQGQACRHRQAHITPSLITEAGTRPWEK